MKEILNLRKFYIKYWKVGWMYSFLKFFNSWIKIKLKLWVGESEELVFQRLTQTCVGLLF